MRWVCEATLLVLYFGAAVFFVVVQVVQGGTFHAAVREIVPFLVGGMVGLVLAQPIAYWLRKYKQRKPGL